MLSRFLKPKKQNPSNSIREAELAAKNIKLELEIQKLRIEKRELESRLKTKEFIDVRLGDPSPVDTVKRATYVAKVAGLHKEILEPKIKHMISNAHSLLEESTNDREFDQSVKGGIYMLWEICRWGELMVNEQISNQTSQNPSLSEEKTNN